MQQQQRSSATSHVLTMATQSNATSRLDTSSKWDKVREAFLHGDSPTQTDSPSPRPYSPYRSSEAFLSPTAKSVEPQLVASSSTCTGVVSGGASQPEQKLWGTAEDICKLNRDIQTCLEIEGVSSPESFFTAPLEKFPSVAHYYVDLMKRLDPVGIDLYASFASHLGKKHPVVRSMSEILSKKKPHVYITREPTYVREERQRVGNNIRVPGLKEFAEECRMLSWVIRTGEQAVPPHEEVPPDANAERIPADESIDATSSRYSTDNKDRHPIICPGLPSIDQPFELDAHPQHFSPQRRQSTKPPLFSRLLSCLCFAPNK